MPSLDPQCIQPPRRPPGPAMGAADARGSEFSRALSLIPPIGIGSDFHRAIQALSAAGFELAASSLRTEHAVPATSAFRGTPPLPVHHALLAHPSGLLALARSGRDGLRDVVDSFAVHYCIDFGTHAARARGLNPSSMAWTESGSVHAIGRIDAARLLGGRPILSKIADDLLHDGRPLPLAEWPPGIVAIPHGLWSDAPTPRTPSSEDRPHGPGSTALSRATRWDAFVAGLQPHVRRLLGEQGRAASPCAPIRSEPARAYAADAMFAAGTALPLPTQAAASQAWSHAIDSFCDRGAELASLGDYPSMDGANLLHALCSTDFSPDEAARLSAWLDHQDPAALARACESLDPLGMTPAGLGFARLLACDGEHDGVGQRMAALLFERGLLGPPGSLGSAAFLALEELEEAGREPNPVLCAALFAMASKTSLAAGTDWLVPLRAEHGPVLDRDVALGLLMRRLPTPPPGKEPLFESLVMQAATFGPGKPQAPSPPALRL